MSSKPGPHANWDATREQNPERAEWMAHAQKKDMEAALRMYRIVSIYRHFRTMPERQIKNMELTADNRRRAGNKKASAAGRRFDQKSATA